MKKISKKLEKLLETEKFKYEIFEHRTTYTAHDTAATTAKSKIKPVEIVKSLIVKADREYLLVLLPANKILDTVKFKKFLNALLKKKKQAMMKQDPKEAKKIKAYKKVELAKEAWMKKNIPGKIGATPPFSKLIKLDVFVENILLKQKKLYLGTGEYELSIKTTPAQYQKLEDNLVKGSFGRARKK